MDDAETTAAGALVAAHVARDEGVVTLPVPSSGWIVLDGVVWPADVLPQAKPATGRVTAARAKIREQIARRR